MTKLHLATAAALLIGATGVASAQTYYGPVDAATGTAATVVDGAAGAATGVVGGVGDLVGGVVAAPGQILTGRSAYETPYAAPTTTTPCTVTGGGAVGTCNSALYR